MRSDLKLSLRTLAKAPWLTATAIAAMALGIGLSTAAFSVADELLFARLPVPEGERIVRLEDWYPKGRYAIRCDRAAFERRRRAFTSFQAVGGYESRDASLLLEDGSSRVVRMAFITPNAFDLVGLPPAMGRSLLPDDLLPGKPPVMLIGHSLWQSLGARHELVGSSATIEGELRSIIGVMPEGFLFPDGQQAWVPLSASGPPSVRLWAFAKLKAGVSLEQAQAEFQTVGRHLPAQEEYEADEIALRVLPFTRTAGDDFNQAALGLLLTLMLVLLAAAANVANLLLARTASRSKEIAVRAALGASRLRILGQLLAEVGLMGAIAALLGLAASRPMLLWLESLLITAEGVPWWIDFTISPSVMAFAAGMTLLACAVAGLPPAFKATRLSPRQAIQDAEASVFGLRLGGLSRAMIVAETAISIGLLSASAMLGMGLIQYGPGSSPPAASQTLVAQLDFGAPIEQSPQAWRQLHQRSEASRIRIEQRLRGEGGLRAITFASRVPGYELWSDARPVELEPGEASVQKSASKATVVEIGQDYFETFQVDLLAGRGFGQADRSGQAFAAAIVNRSFARKHFADANPLGHRLRFGYSLADGTINWQPWIEIVGVAPDIGLHRGDPSISGAVYVPRRPLNNTLMAARLEGDPRSLVPALYKALAADEMDVQVHGVWPLDELIEFPVRLLGGVGGAALALGGLALLLSAMGLYSILSFSVTRRTREIGIRMALGALPGRILGSIVGRAALPLIAGMALGCLLGIAISMIIPALLAELLPAVPMTADPLSLSFAVLSMAVAGLAASLAPARRAMSVMPMSALRHN